MPREDDAYVFQGEAPVRWPRRDGAGLGAAGYWNLLWRAGFAPRAVSPDQLPASPAVSDLLCVQVDGPLTAGSAIDRWVSAGARVLLTGRADAVAGALPIGTWSAARPSSPYAGVALLDSRTLIAPAGWPYSRLAAATPALTLTGSLASVGGERQTPGRALIEPLESAPASVQALDRRLTFLNGNPFAAFQAWLQGQEDLQPWLQWRHRLFWLDEYAADLVSWLVRLGVLDDVPARRPIAGLGETTVVLRHDLDHSRDTAYLDEERARALPATHAVLNDGNRAFWASALAPHHDHEAALHYTTASRDWPRTAARAIARRPGGVMRPDRGALSPRGLQRQIARMRSAGIQVATLHRHLAFLPYPEIVETLDHIFRTDRAVRGSSTFFRAHVCRWGDTGSALAPPSIGEWPDAQFPLWLPFKLGHAGRGRLLDGWESTSIMEPEPGLVAQLIAHRIPRIVQRVLTLNFHPAHARTPRFAAGGSLGAFRQVLDVIRDAGADVRTLRDVYAAADAALPARRFEDATA